MRDLFIIAGPTAVGKTKISAFSKKMVFSIPYFGPCAFTLSSRWYCCILELKISSWINYSLF